MAEVAEVTSSDATEVFAAGRRHLAVKDYSNAVSNLGRACELLAEKYGEQADECAESYLWYGKALLGLSREESGVLGDKVPQNEPEADKESDEDENGEEDGDESDTGENENELEKDSTATKPQPEEESAAAAEKKTEASDDAGTSKDEQPGQSNGEGNGEDPAAELGDDDDVDNLQLAWEMLDLCRAILERRNQTGGDARALLADVHLTLGEVALESETYDKAVLDIEASLKLQKQLYKNDDRRIAETHYQLGLAYSLSSNFDDAITHFKNAANILETRIKTLEDPKTTEDAAVKKHSAADPLYSVAGEVRELRELLPEIHEKIQDMIDYKAETIKRVREQLCPSNGVGASNGQGSSAGQSSSTDLGSSISSSNGATTQPKQASDISHLIKRKRKPSGEEGGTPSKNLKP